MAIYQLKKEQKIPADIDTVWDFISTPKNLSKISPTYMDFRITTYPIPDILYPGLIIMYKVSPFFNMKMTWVTEITHVKEKEYFVDEQRLGPYFMWHHEHKISKIENGVLMEDLVTYAPPLGFLGRIANNLFIEKKLDEIFDYRYHAIIREFGQY